MAMTVAMNSSALSDVRKRQSTGSSIRQARPVTILYPPSPCSEASDRYKWVGFLNVSRFRETPEEEAMMRNLSINFKSSISDRDKVVNLVFIVLCRAFLSRLIK
jgi:hypothetical protein